MIKIDRAHMLYLREKLPDVIPTIVNRGKRRGYRAYYVEPSREVLSTLNDEEFWDWYRSQPIKVKVD